MPSSVHRNTANLPCCTSNSYGKQSKKTHPDRRLDRHTARLFQSFQCVGCRLRWNVPRSRRHPVIHADRESAGPHSIVIFFTALFCQCHCETVRVLRSVQHMAEPEVPEVEINMRLTTHRLCRSTSPLLVPFVESNSAYSTPYSSGKAP